MALEMRSRIFALNDIKLYAKNEQINLCFSSDGALSEKLKGRVQMKLIATYYFIVSESHS